MANQMSCLLRFPSTASYGLLLSSFIFILLQLLLCRAAAWALELVARWSRNPWAMFPIVFQLWMPRSVITLLWCFHWCELSVLSAAILHSYPETVPVECGRCWLPEQYLELCMTEKPLKMVLNKERTLLALSSSFSAFGSEEATVQLSSVVPNPGSSDTSHLHHAAQVRPQRDQSRVLEVHRRRGRRHIRLGP